MPCMSIHASAFVYGIPYFFALFLISAGHRITSPSPSSGIGLPRASLKGKDSTFATLFFFLYILLSQSMRFFSSSTMDNSALRFSLRSTDCATFFKRARGTISFVRLFSSITPNGLLYSLYRFPAFPQGPEFIEGQPHLTESFLYAMIITAHKEEKMPTLRARIRRALRLVLRFLGQVLVGLARGTALIIRDIHRFL